MKVQGHRVLLDRPEIKDTGIELSKELQEQFLLDEIKKWKKIRVHAVGEEVTFVKEGDYVYVEPIHLANGSAVEIDGETKIMLRELDIAIKW